MTTRRELLVALSVGALAVPLAAFAQQKSKIWRIGFLGTASASGIAGFVEALRAGLRDLGYVEGKNIVIEFRWAEGKYERLPELAAELVRLKVDVIVTHGPVGPRAAKAAATTIPIVMAISSDAVGMGFVASLARPGGNVTGLTSMNLNLGGKILDVLKDMVPKLGHVAILGPAGSAADDLFLKNTEMPAQALKIKVTTLMVRGPEDYESAFRTATKDRVHALVVRGTPSTSSADRKTAKALGLTIPQSLLISADKVIE